LSPDATLRRPAAIIIRDRFHFRFGCCANWRSCACDLAEVIGSAIALNLLFKIPLVFGVCITALDVLAVMYLQNKGFRYIEALVVTLILTIGGCFLVEIIFSHPSLPAVLAGFVPRAEVVQNPKMLFIAIGILGATVMPHNLYLHSSIVQTRKYDRLPVGKRKRSSSPPLIRRWH